jgi:hypothetical protein
MRHSALPGHGTEGAYRELKDGSKEFSPGQTISASHYFRPRGLALLVFQLSHMDEATFMENSQLLSL